jgi:hypothetical protein
MEVFASASEGVEPVPIERRPLESSYRIGEERKRILQTLEIGDILGHVISLSLERF